MSVFLWLPYFIWHNVLKVHPCCSMFQNVLPLESWIIFRCMYMSNFICSPAVGRWGCFHVLAVANNAVTNAGVQIPLWDSAFNSFGYKPRSKIAGSYGNSIFLSLFYLFILRKRKSMQGRSRERERERWGERESQAGSALSAQRPTQGGARTHKPRDHDLSQDKGLDA